MLRYTDSRDGREGLERLAELIPASDEIEPSVEIDAGGNMFWRNLNQQMQGALWYFSPGWAQRQTCLWVDLILTMITTPSAKRCLLIWLTL